MRDPQRQYVYGSTLSVSFPDFPSMSRLPRYITVHQEMGQHDVIELYYQTFSPFMTDALKTGVPVVIEWSNDKTSKKIHGYTTDVSFPTMQVIERYMKVTCVAASYPLKERTPKIWKNVTASEIVTDIAKEYNLTPVVTPSPIRFGQRSSTKHSRWEFIASLADTIGYGFQVIGTELHFHPVDVMIDKFMTTIPTLAFLDPFLNPTTNYNAQTLDYFQPRLGDHIEKNANNRTLKVLGGVDPVSGKVYKASASPSVVGKDVRSTVKDPLFKSNETAVTTGSQKMATDIAEAKAQMARLSIPAKGEAQGDPRISPWATIEIRGTGSTSDGFWIVESATHTIHYDGRYKTEFTALVDGVGTNKRSATRPTSAGVVPSRDLNLSSSTANFSTPTSPKLSAKELMVNQTGSGFNTLKRRWVGR